MHRLLALAALVALLLAAPALAAPAPTPPVPTPGPVAPGSSPVDPFQAPGGSPPASTPTTTPGTSAGTGGGGLGTAGEISLYVIGGLLLGGIAFVIVRDARRAAPARRRVPAVPVGDDGPAPGGAARAKARRAGRKLSPAERRRRKRGRAR